jgi:hypothetical protein
MIMPRAQASSALYSSELNDRVLERARQFIVVHLEDLTSIEQTFRWIKAKGAPVPSHMLFAKPLCREAGR